MYHHRYQPHQTSHLANRNNNAFGNQNHQQHHQSVSSSSSNAPAVASAPPPSQRLNNNLAGEFGPAKIPFHGQVAPPASHSAPRYHNNNTFGNHIKPGGINSAYNSGAYASQPKQFAEERQDVIFRRVRGILNKITPETFDKLSKELINVGLDSPRTLRGLIYLLFDKALKDLKYSSLYAKLCQQLSEKAPNFETEPGPNTFCKFLISKCEDEFERRRKATEDFECKHELTDEEFEQKVIAKQKMLGNIKFICELGKKRLLQEEILHECIRGLLSKKKERPLQDQAQDLECLCQIMRTIGSLLDIDASRNLMNQYFERIDMYSRKPELPSRIRFMLRDVIDLRNNKWRPRPFQKEDYVPQPLSRLREEAGFTNPAIGVSLDKIGNTKNLMNIGDLSKMHGSRLSALLMEDDGPSFTTTTDFHWGSNSFMPNETEFDIFSTTVPVQKIDTSQRLTSAPSTIRTNSTFSTNSTHNTTSVSKNPIYAANQFNGPSPHQISQNRQFGGASNNSANNNGGSNAHNNNNNKSDQSIDSHRLNRFNHNDRQPFFKDNIMMEPRGNQGAVGRNAPPGSIERRNQFDVGPLPATRLKSPMSNDMDPILMRQNGEGRLSNNNGMPPVRSSNNRDEFAPRDPRMPPGVGVGPSQRPGRNEPISNDIVPSMAPINRQDIPNYNRASRNGSDPIVDGLGEQQRFANGGPGPRDRRMDGGNGGNEREHRQPKFSGANYRLPGGMRPLQNQPPRDQFLANRGEPESDLNLNWRSKQASEPLAQPNKDLIRTNVARKASIERPPAAALTMDRQNSTSNEFVDPRRGPYQNAPMTDSMPERFKRPQQAINPIDFDGARTQQRSPPAQAKSSRFDEFNATEQSQDRNLLEDPMSLHSDRVSRRPNANQVQGGHNARDSGHQQARGNGPSAAMRYNAQHEGHPERNNRRDRVDRNDHRFPPIDQAPVEDRKPLPERAGNQRTNMGFGRNRSPESNRANNWRKDAVPHPPAPSKRDQTVTVPVIPGPIVPKPPTRMSETEFTLRPSHLIGRILPDVSNTRPADKQEAVKSTAAPTVAATTASVASNIATPAPKPEPRAQLDVVAKQSNPAAFDHAETENKKPVQEDSPKSVSKDQYVSKFMSLVKQMAGDDAPDTSKVAAKVKELKITKSVQHECLLSVMKQSIIGLDIDREKTSKLLVSLVPSVFESSSLLSAFKIIFEQMQALEAETPKVKTLVAEFLSRSVVDGLLALEEVASILSGGKHHPLFLLLLQKLEKAGGRAWLSEKFIASKINLIDMLPEVDRSKERLASTLKDRCLGFLDPMLTIEPDLWQQMKENDPSPAAIYRWIKDNVDQTIQMAPTFAHVFIACLLRYTHTATMNKFSKTSTSQSSDSGDSSSKSSPENSVSSQAANEYEKELLTKYQQVLQALLKDKPMQLATLYAVQAFYHALEFPKGALLRWFHMLYDLSIVDDDVFFIWKEEINNEFPGKGQALFQVNTWLNWLAEAESEDEEE